MGPVTGPNTLPLNDRNRVGGARQRTGTSVESRYDSRCRARRVRGWGPEDVSGARTKDETHKDRTVDK